MDETLLLRLAGRTGFGARPGEIGSPADLRKRLGGDDGAELPTFDPLVRPPMGEDRKEYRRSLKEQGDKLIIWWLDRMVTAENPWPEKRTLIWHDFWATSLQKVRMPSLMARQQQTLRRLGNGDFRALARAMVRDPALMIWLDAGGNTARSPNENLARELMELFTLGVGNYSEEDIRQAARALTGWRINRRKGGEPAFVRRRHAPGTQTVFGKTGDHSDEGIADLCTARPESATYVVTRLWQRLVAPTPPTKETLDRLVDAYGSARDLKALFAAMFAVEELEDPANVLVKMPLEWLAGSMRALGLRPDELPSQRLIGGLRAMGQVPFKPPDVSGWPSDAAWLTTAATQARIGLAQLFASRAGDTDIDRLGVRRWTSRTEAALSAARGRQRLVLALCSPEYAVNS